MCPQLVCWFPILGFPQFDFWFMIWGFPQIDYYVPSWGWPQLTCWVVGLLWCVSVEGGVVGGVWGSTRGMVYFQFGWLGEVCVWREC